MDVVIEKEPSTLELYQELHNGRIEALEREMLKLPQAPCGVRHHFIAGLYIRELKIAADTYAIGHKHKLSHINILLKGKVAMVAPDGSTVELVAPYTFIGAPGRKVGYIREDMTWLNIFQTDETDVSKLEGILFDKSEAFEQAAALLTSEPVRLVTYDQEDYREWLQETSVHMSERELIESFNQDSDLIRFPPGTYKVKIAASRIHGRGVIATDNIACGEEICATRIGEQRTPAGRFINHARDPNARMVLCGQVITLVALRDIKGAHGGFDGEEVTVNYRGSFMEAEKAS
jgi:hypothetical protein